MDHKKNLVAIDCFAIALRLCRAEAGLTQEDLAARADVSVRHLSMMENRDRQPTLTTLVALSTGLGLPLEELVRRFEAVYQTRNNVENGETI